MRSGVAVFVLAFLSASCSTVPVLADPESAPTPAESEPSPVGTDAFALLAEADHLAALDLWPGFDPVTFPVAIFDGERTILFRHPAPPAEFTPVPGREDVWTYAGRHPSVVANTSTELAGIMTATLIQTGTQTALRERAGLLIHELFHVFQRERHPGWAANEAELFTYPVDAPELLTLRRLETEALRRALAANATGESRCWTGTALALRRVRFSLLPAGAVDYERGTEINEGLAAYVERRATGSPDHTLLPREDFAPEAIRPRGYRTGAALARLLDRFAPTWRSTLEENDATALDLLLAAAYDAAPDVHDGAPDTHADSPARCEFDPAELNHARTIAMVDIDSLHSRLEEARRAFLDRSGWTLVIDAADAPLFPQGFNPLGIQVVAPGEVLHSGYVKLGNEAGAIEVIGRAALTEAAGAHPLFNGVRSLTITGLENEPTIETTDGVATLTADGVSATLHGATVEHRGRNIIVRLRR